MKTTFKFEWVFGFAVWLNIAGLAYLKKFHPEISTSLGDQMIALTKGKEQWYKWITNG